MVSGKPLVARSLEGPAAHLPVSLTSLVGRERELAALQVLLRDQNIRLVTLTGPGGVGKTRLASEVARSLAPEFPDGVYFVSLAEVGDPRQVPATLALALGVREEGERPVVETLRSELALRAALIVVDNFEHVDAAAPILADLLAASPGLRLLVTSRSLLHVRGEYHFALSPLAVPGATPLPPVTELAGMSAIRLFAERARAATGEFTLTSTNAAAVANICRRLDGLPLAIELAAAWTRLLPPAALAERLASRLMELGGGPRDLPERQQTLRDTIAWSYALLDAEERELFAKLSVFAGGWTIEAAEAVASPEHSNIFAGLGRLIDRSLVRSVPSAGGDPRFGMLETIREYARERLDLSGNRGASERRHSQYLLSMAMDAREKLDGPDHATWLAKLVAEHDNLRATLDRAIEAGDPDTGLRLATALWGYWTQRGHVTEARETLERALTLEAIVAPTVRAAAIHCLGNLALDLSDLAAARSYFTEYLTLMDDLGDQDGIATGHNGLGIVERDLGAYQQARSHFEAALRLWSNLGDASGIALSHHNLGIVATAEGEYERASTHHHQALAIRRQLGHVDGVAYSLRALATVARLSGDTTAAKVLIEDSLQSFVELGNRQGESRLLGDLAAIAYQSGDDPEALRLYRIALAAYQSLADSEGMIGCIEGIASVTVRRGHLEQGVRLLRVAEQYRGSVVPARTAAEQHEHERTLTIARRTLTVSAFNEAWAAGQGLSLEQAAAEALLLTEDSTVVARPAAPFNLTRREQEVLALLCQHLTDGEIAEKLYLSSRTASNHVASILSKLGVPSRREAIAFATQHGLV